MPGNREDAPLGGASAGSEPSVDHGNAVTAPLIVAGMHRSGASLVASFLSALGVDMGELIPSDDRNPKGSFQDRRFLELHRRMLDAATPKQKDGHRGWGFTEDQDFDTIRLNDFRDEARTLIEARLATAGPWGWKDPRATLLLEFWDDVIDDLGIGPARYVLLYRSPWDVSDSMQRLGADVFLEHPEYGFRIWTYYNRELLRFFRQHSEDAVLVYIDALVRQPERFVSLVSDKLELTLGDASLDEVYEPGLLSTVSGSDPLISLLAATEPEIIDLLAELDREADLSGAGLWEATEYRTRLLRPDTGDVTPDLSIVIPCHDDGQFLVEAVASVERTDFESCELIIVNDGSRKQHTLGILEILREAGHYVIDQANRGVPEARNRGIREARGPYILPLDADNRLRPGFAAAAVETLDRLPEVGVVYGDCLEFGKRSGLRNPPEFDLTNLLRGNYIDACAAFRRAVWEEVGGYDPALLAWEDWEFWISVASRGWQFSRLPDVSFEYRVRPGSNVTLTEKPEVHEQIINHVVTKHFDLFKSHLPQDLILWQRDVGARHNTAEHLSSEIGTRDHEISRLRAEAGARDQEITALRSQLEARDQQIDAQRVTLEERNRRIAELRSDLEERDRQVDAQRVTLQEHGRRIESLNAKLEDRDAEIHSIRAKLEERDRHIDAQNARLRGLDESISALQRQLEESRRAHADLTRQLGQYPEDFAHIQSTLGWRLLNAWWNLSGRLAPRGTIQRRLYDRIVRRFKASS
jgi:hypothetical protein